MADKNSYRQQRAEMVERHIQSRGITDKRVLSAMRDVPREQFLHRYLYSKAYYDEPLPIGSGQTISQPYIVALMSAALKLQPEDTVLEIGTGSGYAAAVLSLLCKKVYTIERIETLANRAEKTIHRLGYHNVEVIVGDGTIGWPAEAPYDAIIATAGGPQVPPTLKAQLALNGRLVMPVGEIEQGQALICVTRLSDTEYNIDDLGGVRFVPLIGAEGWPQQGEHHPRDPLRKEALRRE